MVVTAFHFWHVAEASPHMYPRGPTGCPSAKGVDPQKLRARRHVPQNLTFWRGFRTTESPIRGPSTCPRRNFRVRPTPQSRTAAFWERERGGHVISSGIGSAVFGTFSWAPVNRNEWVTRFLGFGAPKWPNAFPFSFKGYQFNKKKGRAIHVDTDGKTIHQPC